MNPMRSLVRAALLALAVYVAAGNAVERLVPFEWGHVLSEGCEWRSRPFLGLARRGYEKAQARRWACKGDHYPSRSVNLLLARFPSPKERAQWSAP